MARRILGRWVAFVIIVLICTVLEALLRAKTGQSALTLVGWVCATAFLWLFPSIRPWGSK